MTATPSSGRTPRHSRRLVSLVMLAAIGIGAAVTGLVIANRHDAQSGGGATVQLAQVQASCRGWMTSLDDDDLPGDGWCTDMFAWMSGRSDGSMMSSHMWQGPEQLGTSCREWADTDDVDAETRRQRCDDMVEWMDGHMSSRGGTWMMQEN
jgi:hypothetical protein